MDVFITGSSSLSNLDKEEIRQYLNLFASKNNIHLLCYRSLENEVLKYFIERNDLADKLHIYTLQAMENLNPLLKESIHYLKTKGSLHLSFDHEGIEVRRSFYEESWRKMLKDKDLVVCFYNGDKPGTMIPIDIAKEINVEAMVYELPGMEIKKRHRKMEDKIRII